MCSFALLLRVFRSLLGLLEPLCGLLGWSWRLFGWSGGCLQNAAKNVADKSVAIFAAFVMFPCVSLRVSDARRSHSRPRNEPRRGFQDRMGIFKSGEKRTRHVRVHLSLPFSCIRVGVVGSPIPRISYSDQQTSRGEASTS